VTFSRRLSKDADKRKFNYLVGNRDDLLRGWIERTNLKEYDCNKPEEIAFKERMPIKIGATADPFPYIEKHERITYKILKLFNEYDYPVQMSTKILRFLRHIVMSLIIQIGV